MFERALIRTKLNSKIIGRIQCKCYDHIFFLLSRITLASCQLNNLDLLMPFVYTIHNSTVDCLNVLYGMLHNTCAVQHVYIDMLQ